MISYEFNCENCGKIELRMNPSDAHEKMVCPKCGGNLQMIFSPTPDHWHTTGCFKNSN